MEVQKREMSCFFFMPSLLSVSYKCIHGDNFETVIAIRKCLFVYMSLVYISVIVASLAWINVLCNCM